MQLLKRNRAESSGSTEDVLVRQAAAGDAEAFADLYDGHLDRIFRYFYYRIGHREDAEDLTEQVFLKAWQAIPKYDQRGVPFSAWLFRVAYNVLVDRQRSHRETTQLDDTLAIEDDGAGTEEIVGRRLEVQELAGALGTLSDVEKSVVILRFIEGLDHRSVAGIIGKSEVATRSIQSRALGRLAQVLGAGEGRNS